VLCGEGTKSKALLIKQKGFFVLTSEAHVLLQKSLILLFYI
jgi:hypothetical protein